VGCLFVAFVYGVIFYPAGLCDLNVIERKTSDDLLKKIFHYGLPFVPMAVIAWAYSVGDRYLLVAFTNVSDVGQYVAIFSIGSRPFIMLSTVLTSILRPILFDAESIHDSEKAREIMRIWLFASLIFSSLGVLLFCKFARFFSTILLSKEYRIGAPKLLVWTAVGYAIYSLIQALENGLFGKGESKRVILPQVLNTVLFLLLALLLIPKFGMLGAVQAKTIGFALQFFVTLVVFYRSRIRPPHLPIMELGCK
jgi:O-antigen/teichoic acid export membrane protein